MKKKHLVEEMLRLIERIDCHLERGDKESHRGALIKIKAELKKRIKYLQVEEHSGGFELRAYGWIISDSWDYTWKLGEELLGVEQDMKKYLARR